MVEISFSLPEPKFHNGDKVVLRGEAVILVTAPKGKGVEIARKLVEARIAACVNVGNVKSIYWWQGKIEEDDEEILVIKTRLELVDKIVEYVKRIHPYQVPEIIILPIIGGYEEYLRWVRENTRK